MRMAKHSWLMMAGCGMMLVGVFILPLLGVRLGGALPVLFALACPLSMLFMMGFMGHNHASHASTRQEDDQGVPCHGET
jgi:hypothetical protein